MGSKGIALFIRDLGARRGWVVSTTPRPLLKLILLVECKDVSSVQSAQHRDQWRILVNIIMKLRDY
jgi:hypothetical protein